MNGAARIIATLSSLQAIAAFTPEVLDNSLRSIEYLASVHPGVFSCVFYDAAPLHPRDNILESILKSPRLDHVTKYVVNGSERVEVQKLPWNPSLVVLHTGNNVSHLERFEVMVDIFYVMFLFDPATKLLLFVDELFSLAMNRMMGQVYNAKFAYSAFVDSASGEVYQCNTVWCWNRSGDQHPMYLFTLYRRYLKGYNITYIKYEEVMAFAWNSHWLNETARYLSTEAVEWPGNCEASEDAYQRCFQEHAAGKGADILLVYMTIHNGSIPRNFQQLFTSLLRIARIAVPRDRPLNTAELLVMPFNWQVWALLVTILGLTEIVKRLFPGLLQNDPVLLVVCGYERHDLHQASRAEKIILLSLIVLMFFMSNAFETKIISLMVSQPSIQSIQTLDDLLQSGLKIYHDLEKNQYTKDSFMDKVVAQGTRKNFYETVPGEAVYWDNEYVEVFKEVAFDYERMQPFYEVLDYEHIAGFEMYWVSPRNVMVQEFRFVHITLVESGLMDLWKQRWRDDLRAMYIGRRPRVDINEKADLNFDDMQPAWMALGVGLGASVIGFVGELVKARFDGRVLRIAV